MHKKILVVLGAYLNIQHNTSNFSAVRVSYIIYTISMREEISTRVGEGISTRVRGGWGFSPWAVEGGDIHRG